MKKRLVLLMALSLTFAFPAAVMAEDTTAAEETADDTEAADSTAEDAEVKSEGVMTHDEYLAAAVDDEVTIETYVQAKQSWWEDKATFYTQDKDGAYFIYNMPCSEEDYEKLVPGTKIKVTGYKAEWSGEIEVADVSSFEIEDGEYIAEPLDVTDLLGKDELIDHQNELVSFKGMTVEAAGQDADGNDVAYLYNYDGSGSEGDDLYFNVSLNGETYTFTVESYLCDKDSDVYKNVESDDFVLKDDSGAVDGIAYVIETYGLIYNKALLKKYCEMDGAVIKSADEINNFETLKKVADDIQAKKDDLGVDGAFTSAGFDSSSDWRFKTHLANLPIYYEYKEDGITSTDAIKGTYLDNFKNLFDLYITDSTCEPSLLSSKTIDDANAEFGLGEAVFYQNGTWAYDSIKDNEVADEDMGMLPIYIGVDGEEDQGLCTGSENYWCVNKKADEKDIQATLDFLSWVITSDEGRESISQEMGFTTPFKTFDENYESTNPLVKAANEYVKAGKTPVSWNFTTMPSEEWKNQVGSAMLEYAQGTGEWDAVKTAFVDGWAKEYKAANEG